MKYHEKKVLGHIGSILICLGMVSGFNALGGDSAQLVSVTVTNNTVVMPRAIFTQTWTLQNNGTTTWSPGVNGYTLNLVGLDCLGATPISTVTSPTSYLVSTVIGSGTPIAPGGQATFSMSFIAPEASGTYTDSFQINGTTNFGPTNVVQIVVPKTGDTNHYDRARAVSYANNYAGYVCSDGYFWTNSGSYCDCGAFSPVPTAVIGDDCAHFVSCCIGRESHLRGGGLTISSSVPPTYGNPAASGIVNTALIGAGYAKEVFSFTNMVAGDVIGWNWEGNTNIGSLDHVTFYVGNGMAAAHASSCLDAPVPSWYANVGTPVYHLIHINNVPAINANPTNATVQCGSNIVLFATSASGDMPLYFHWYSNSIAMKDGGAVAGSSTATLSLTHDALAASGASYSVIVTNSVGAETSLVAKLTVIDTTPPVVALTGPAATNIQCHTRFTDPGATANDSCAGSLPVTTLGSVNTNVPSVYTLTYTAIDPSGNAGLTTRAVTVADTTPPVMTLIGPTSTNVAQNSAFSDPGATANDVCAGSLSVTTKGSVKISTAGSYTLSYLVADPSGNTATNFRSVLVYIPAPPQLQNPQRVGGNFNFTWPTIPGNKYQIQYTTDLRQPIWTNLSTPMIAATNILSVSSPMTNALIFYRVVLVQ